ncbi:methyltransferase [Fistulina hepatica ATCC 64428]|uniref:Methyltransferase n=1 Tax=Fistulina hepatica ATCC 64428 TaxID=1128425 RepID=A0A0D7A750_9AGAR|nr:methyltransferase [Fistulina hepatica ATCC 64428]
MRVAPALQPQNDTENNVPELGTSKSMRYSENSGLYPPEATPKSTSSVRDPAADWPPFGSRFLTDEERVWDYNAWDHVPPPDDQDEQIAASLAKQKSAPVPEDQKHIYNNVPYKHWDQFYKHNENNFFRDRKWIQNEFPELVASTQEDAGPMTVVEIGCGAGNAVFPLLVVNKNPHLKLRAYDYSPRAIELVQRNELYASPPVGEIRAAVWDLTSSELPDDVEPGTADIVTLVFVLSALHPDEWRRAVDNIGKVDSYRLEILYTSSAFQILKPGGLVCLRDYGRYDMAQLRFKAGRLLDNNFYIRGDKTRVYFFELGELAFIFTGSTRGAWKDAVHVVQEETGVEVEQSDVVVEVAEGMARPERGTAATDGIHPNLCRPPLGGPSQFTTVSLGVDRRLIVNRKRKLKMYRVWMQGMFRKNNCERNAQIGASNFTSFIIIIYI